MESDARSADEIQRDIERERADLSDTLSSLSDGLSYENLSATLTDQVRGMGSDVIDDLAGTMIERARQKPVAAGLVLAGLAWMAVGSPDRRSLAPHQPATDVHTRSSFAPDVQKSAPSFESARSAANERIERLARDAETLRDRVSQGTEALSEEARARVVQARKAAAEAAEQAVDAMRSGAGKAKNVVQDNPFAVGGVALAIGAAVGGVLLLRKQEQDTREARNELFLEADRIMTEELERSGPPKASNRKT